MLGYSTTQIEWMKYLKYTSGTSTLRFLSMIPLGKCEREVLFIIIIGGYNC